MNREYQTYEISGGNLDMGTIKESLTEVGYKPTGAIKETVFVVGPDGLCFVKKDYIKNARTSKTELYCYKMVESGDFFVNYDNENDFNRAIESAIKTLTSQFGSATRTGANCGCRRFDIEHTIFSSVKKSKVLEPKVSFGTMQEKTKNGETYKSDKASLLFGSVEKTTSNGIDSRVFLRNILKADDNINISEQPIDYLKKYIIENVGLEQEER